MTELQPRAPAVRRAGTAILRGTPNALLRGITTLGGRGGALVILLVLVVFFALTAENFLTSENLLNILRQYSVVAILAVGQTCVIVSAGIDLSVGANAALSGSLMTVAFAQWGWPEPVALALGLLAGVGVGAANGLVITKWKVPDFVATLGALTAVRGIALLVTNGLPVPSYTAESEGRTIPGVVSTLGADSVSRIPLIAVVAVACALVGSFLLSRTKLGRATYAVGGNREAARVSGIRVERTKIWIYVFSGLMAAVAGFMLTGRQDSANALMADGTELQSIAAVVIGGTNLFGGEGSVGGTIVGVLIIGVLANGLNILGVSDFWQRVVNGSIVIVVVALDQWRRRASQRRSA